VGRIGIVNQQQTNMPVYIQTGRVELVASAESGAEDAKKRGLGAAVAGENKTAKKIPSFIRRLCAASLSVSLCNPRTRTGWISQ